MECRHWPLATTQDFHWLRQVALGLEKSDLLGDDGVTSGHRWYARAMADVLLALDSDREPPATLRQLADEDARGIAYSHGLYDDTPEQAEAAGVLDRHHAWKVRQLMNDYFFPSGEG